MKIVFAPVLSSDHWEVGMAHECRIIRLQRTEVPIESVEGVHSSFAAINKVLAHIPMRSWGLLFDMRRARPAHNPAIEAAFRENRLRFYGEVGRYGVLVKTTAGVMQVKRMLRATPDLRIEVFADEDEALKWVSAVDLPARTSSFPE